MNYLQIYDDLVNRALKEKRLKLKKDHRDYVYYENHHVVPKCLGGENNNENYVLLTGKEHFIAHKLLVEIYPEEAKLIYSLWMMSIVKLKQRDYRIGSREYSRVRKLHSEIISGKVISEETKLKMSKRMTGKGNHQYGKIGELSPNYGRKQSKECIEKVRKANLGRKCSEETKEKIRQVNIGKLCSEETKIKMNKTWQSKPKVICPYCNKQGGESGMKSWHFEYCLKNPKNINTKNRKQKIVKCPYCWKIGGVSIMKNYHFENCKQNPINKGKDMHKRGKQKLVTCPHCKKEGGNIMYRYHFNNCKLKK